MFKYNPYRKGYISMYRTAQAALKEFPLPSKKWVRPVLKRQVRYRQPNLGSQEYWNKEREEHQRWLRLKAVNAAYEKQKQRVTWIKRRISYRNRPLPDKPPDIPQRMWDDEPFHFIPHHLPITKPPIVFVRRRFKNPYRDAMLASWKNNHMT